MYWFFKDFSAPIATIIASLTGAVFLYCQWRTAERQAETALDQLRWNLFTKRCAIYESTKDLLKSLINNNRSTSYTAFEAIQHYTVMDEAIFYFLPETCDWLKSIQEDCQKFIEEYAVRGTAEAKPREYAALQSKLIEHFRAMPERFERELRFRRLTQNVRE